MTDEPALDRDAVAASLHAAWLADLSDEEQTAGATTIEAIVDEWAREAAVSSQPDAVLEILRADLDEACANQPDGPLAGLARYLLNRQVARLGAETFSLATQVVDGTVGSEEAAIEGAALLGRTEELADEVNSLPDDPGLAALRARLGDAMLEARYAIDQGAMSLRLGRYAGDAEAPDLQH